jgi:hypothetical protein
VPVETTDAAAELDRGQQVRERLAGARARLGQQQAAVFEHLAHGLGETLLRGPFFVRRQRAGQLPCPSEEGPRGHGLPPDSSRVRRSWSGGGLLARSWTSCS